MRTDRQTDKHMRLKEGSGRLANAKHIDIEHTYSPRI